MAAKAKYNGIALIIGVGVYKSPHFRNLENAICDARAMSLYLETHCNYFVQYLENPSSNEITVALKNDILKRIASDAYRNVIIYFAGHGFFNNGVHYLVLSEFMNSSVAKFEDQLEINAFRTQDIVDSMSSTVSGEKKERAVVVILDTCREFISHVNFPVKRGVESGASGSSTEQQNVIVLHSNAQIGFLISYACELGERAQNDGGNGYGLYTSHVLRKILEPGVNIIAALGHANQTVYNISKSNQKPRMQINFPHMFKFSLREAGAAPLEVL